MKAEEELERVRVLLAYHENVKFRNLCVRPGSEGDLMWFAAKSFFGATSLRAPVRHFDFGQLDLWDLSVASRCVPYTEHEVYEAMISPRTLTLLRRKEIRSVRDVLKVGFKSLQAMKGFGEVAQHEILQSFAALGGKLDADRDHFLWEIWLLGKETPKPLWVCDVAKQVGVTPATVRRWIAAKKLQAQRLPCGTLRVWPIHLEEFLFTRSLGAPK